MCKLYFGARERTYIYRERERCLMVIHLHQTLFMAYFSNWTFLIIYNFISSLPLAFVGFYVLGCLCGVISLYIPYIIRGCAFMIVLGNTWKRPVSTTSLYSKLVFTLNYIKILICRTLDKQETALLRCKLCLLASTRTQMCNTARYRGKLIAK